MMTRSQRDQLLEAELERNETDAGRWRKLCELAFSRPFASTIAVAPAGETFEIVQGHMNNWIDGLVIKQGRN